MAITLERVQKMQGLIDSEISFLQSRLATESNAEMIFEINKMIDEKLVEHKEYGDALVEYQEKRDYVDSDSVEHFKGVFFRVPFYQNSNGNLVNVPSIDTEWGTPHVSSNYWAERILHRFGAASTVENQGDSANYTNYDYYSFVEPFKIFTLRNDEQVFIEQNELRRDANHSTSYYHKSYFALPLKNTTGSDITFSLTSVHSTYSTYDVGIAYIIEPNNTNANRASITGTTSSVDWHYSSSNGDYQRTESYTVPADTTVILLLGSATQYSTSNSTWDWYNGQQTLGLKGLKSGLLATPGLEPDNKLLKVLTDGNWTSHAQIWTDSI